MRAQLLFLGSAWYFLRVPDSRIENLSAALGSLANSRSTAVVGLLAAECRISIDLLLGALAALAPFGAVTLDTTGDQIVATVPSENARDFIRSFAQMIEAGIVVVDDWYRVGAECADPEVLLDRGVCLLRALGTRKTLRVSRLPTAPIIDQSGKHQPGHGWKASAGSISRRSSRIRYAGLYSGQHRGTSASLRHHTIFNDYLRPEWVVSSRNAAGRQIRLRVAAHRSGDAAFDR